MSRRPFFYICTVLLFLFTSLPLAAQELTPPTVKRQELVFVRYKFVFPFNELWQLEQEFEERAFIDPLRQGEFRLRSRLNRKLGSSGWTAEGGLTLVWESEPIEPYRDDISLRMEIRPHQQISFAHSLGERFGFQHTYKIEQRFFENQNAEGAYDDAGISYARMRFRYELEVGYKVNDWLGLVAIEEIVLQTGREVRPNPFDRNELGLGLEFTLSKALQLDATYYYRYNPEGIGAEIVHQHIGRFTLSHTLGAGKQK